jgi:hypothetical protein
MREVRIDARYRVCAALLLALTTVMCSHGQVAPPPALDPAAEADQGTAPDAAHRADDAVPLRTEDGAPPTRPAATLELSPESSTVLGGRLRARLPVGARADALRPQPELRAEVASTDRRRFGTDDRPMGLVMFDALRFAGPDFESQARRYLDQRPVPREGPRPQFEVRTLTNVRAPLRAVLAIPDRLVFSEASDDLLEVGSGGGDIRHMSAELFVAQADGMVQIIDMVCDVGSCPRDELLTLANELAATLEPGPVPLARTAGPRSLSLFTMDFPADFVASAFEGEDYGGDTVSRLVALDAPAADSLGIFAGSIPPLTESLLAPRTAPGRLLGRPIRWIRPRTTSPGGSSLHHECVLDIFLYSWTLFATTEAGLDELRRIAESARIVPNENVSATARCMPFECRNHRPSEVWVLDERTPLNVRSGPNDQAPVVGTIEGGTDVTMAERSGDWVHLREPVDGWAWAGSLMARCDD